MKKIHTLAIAILLISSVAVQADAYYLYNIYPSSGYNYDNNNHPDKQKQKIKIKGDDNIIYADQYGYFSGNNSLKEKQKIKVKGDNNLILAHQNAYQDYSYSYNPIPYPQPNPCLFSYFCNPQPQPQPQPVNQSPVWSQVPSQTLTVGQTLQFTVYATDSSNDGLTYSATNIPSGAFFNSYSRSFNWVPTQNQVGNYNVVFRVTDGYNSPVDMSVAISVISGQNPNPCNNYYSCNPQPQNRQPIWNQTPSQSVNSGQQVPSFVSAVDPDGDYLNYSATNLPSGATFNQYTRMFYWTPSTYQNGSYNVNFRVTDNTTSPVDMQVWITVQGSQSPNPCYGYNCNSNPNICNNQVYFTSQIPTTQAYEGRAYTYVIQANSQNCTITYRLISGPSGLSINQYSGVITWIPSYNQGGQAHVVTVSASNGYSEANQTFYVYVEDGSVITYPPVYPPVYVPPVQQIEKLKVSEVVIQTDANGDAWVNWETNKPSTSRVIFDVYSQANKTKDFTYDFATPDDIDLVTSHQVNLGQLEANKTFYLRAVSKKGSEVAVSNELTFVKLPCSVNNNCPLAGTTNYHLSDLLSGRNLFWLMFLLIVILAIALMRSYRQPVVVSRLQ